SSRSRSAIPASALLHSPPPHPPPTPSYSFSPSGPHQDPHSFPTRRSSDLSITLEQFYRAINRVERSLIRVGADEATDNLHVMLRSEEHTSELQSRRESVCRLLLEKKTGAIRVEVGTKASRLRSADRGCRGT